MGEQISRNGLLLCLVHILLRQTQVIYRRIYLPWDGCVFMARTPVSVQVVFKCGITFRHSFGHICGCCKCTNDFGEGFILPFLTLRARWYICK